MDTQTQGITQEMSQEELIKENEKEVALFKANEENKQRALTLAQDFFNIMGEKWFTLDKAVKKTAIQDSLTVFQKLKLLEMFGYCMLKRGNPDNLKERGQLTFKILMNYSHKIKAIDDTITQLTNTITSLQVDRKVLIAKNSTIDFTKNSTD